MDRLSRALIIAAQAHDGQLDKAGQPYILHPLRVMLAQTDETARIVGLLHDVVEDSSITLSDLAADFSSPIVAAIDALSRRDGEAYDRYIDRVLTNRLARMIKRADLLDNLNRARTGRAVSSEKIVQYRAALKRLDEAESAPDDSHR